MDIEPLHPARSSKPLHISRYRGPRETIGLILEHEKGSDGGVDPRKTRGISDVCVNGMVLNYASYFKSPSEGLESIADFLLSRCMPDGGFNCRSNRSGAVHSSLHSTLSVAEGILEYRENNRRKDA